MKQRQIHWHATIDSTMTAAAKLAEQGAPHGAAVGADEQTAGQGRHGRAWHSERDAGLYVSVILRVNIGAADLPAVTLALGLAAAEAITELSGVPCDLRWPNDVLIRGRKCCGILTQLHGDAVIAGIGINVNHSSFPMEIASAATSLRIESGRSLDRRVLLNRLLDGMDEHLETLELRGRDAIIRLFTNASSYVRGMRVRLEDTGETGVTAGLDESGFLLLRKDDGSVKQILTGGVRPIEAA